MSEGRRAHFELALAGSLAGPDSPGQALWRGRCEVTMQPWAPLAPRRPPSAPTSRSSTRTCASAPTSAGSATSAPSPSSRRSGRQPVPSDFTRILDRLHAEGVEFVVAGGLAMVAHGSSIVTRDFDLCYRRTPDNLARLARAIAPLHPRLRGAPGDLPFLFDVRTLQA